MINAAENDNLLKVKPKKSSKKSKSKRGTSNNDDDGDSTVFELDERNLFICINQARKVVPSLHSERFVEKNKKEEESELENPQERRKKRIVVILRDFTSKSEENRGGGNVAKELKDKLLSHKIPSYVISTPGLMADLQAINIMKGCTTNLPQMETDTAYRRLLLAIIQTKIRTKGGKVVIINLEREDNWSCPPVMKTFCESVCKAEVFTIDKTESAVFELKLEKLAKRICACRTEKKSSAANQSDKNGNSADCNNNTNSKMSGCDLNCSSGVNIDESDTDDENVERDEILLPVPTPPNTAIHNNNNLDNEQASSDNDHNDNTIDTLPENNNNEVLLQTKIIEVEAAGEVEHPEETNHLTAAKNDEELIESDITMTQADPAQDFSSSAHDPSNNNDEILAGRKPSARIRKKRRHINIPSIQDNNESHILEGGSSQSSNSEASLHMSLVYAQRPKLFKIHLTADESRYPSSVFTRFPLGSNAAMNNISEANLYKGWVAVDKHPVQNLSKTDNLQQQGRTNHSNVVVVWLNKFGTVMKRALRPIGSLFSCQSCKNGNRRVAASSQRSVVVNDYPGIMMESGGFNEKEETKEIIRFPQIGTKERKFIADFCRS